MPEEIDLKHLPYGDGPTKNDYRYQVLAAFFTTWASLLNLMPLLSAMIDFTMFSYLPIEWPNFQNEEND